MLEFLRYIQYGLALLIFLSGGILLGSIAFDEFHRAIYPQEWIDNHNRIRRYGIKMGMIPLLFVVAYVLALPAGWRYLICGIPVAGVWGWITHRWLKVRLGWARDFWYRQ